MRMMFEFSQCYVLRGSQERERGKERGGKREEEERGRERKDERVKLISRLKSEVGACL